MPSSHAKLEEIVDRVGCPSTRARWAFGRPITRSGLPFDRCWVPFDSRSFGLRPTDHSLRTTIRPMLGALRLALVRPSADRSLAQDYHSTDVGCPSTRARSAFGRPITRSGLPFDRCWVPFDSRSFGLRPTDHSLRTTIRPMLGALRLALVRPSADRSLAQDYHSTDVGCPSTRARSAFGRPITRSGLPFDRCWVPFDSRSFGLRPTDHSLRTTIRPMLGALRLALVRPSADRSLAQDYHSTDVGCPSTRARSAFGRPITRSGLPFDRCWVPFDSRSFGLRPTDHSLRTTIRPMLGALRLALVRPSVDRSLAQDYHSTDCWVPFDRCWVPFDPCWVACHERTCGSP